MTTDVIKRSDAIFLTAFLSLTISIFIFGNSRWADAVQGPNNPYGASGRQSCLYPNMDSAFGWDSVVENADKNKATCLYRRTLSDQSFQIFGAKYKTVSMDTGPSDTPNATLVYYYDGGAASLGTYRLYSGGYNYYINSSRLLGDYNHYYQVDLTVMCKEGASDDCRWEGYQWFYERRKVGVDQFDLFVNGEFKKQCLSSSGCDLTIKRGDTLKMEWKTSDAYVAILRREGTELSRVQNNSDIIKSGEWSEVPSNNAGNRTSIKYSITGYGPGEDEGTDNCSYPGSGKCVKKEVTVNIQSNPPSCSPSSQSVGVNQTASFTASGGAGGYSWSGGGNPATGSGASFNTKYSTAGNKTVTLKASDNQTDTCSVTVMEPPTLSGTCDTSSNRPKLTWNNVGADSYNVQRARSGQTLTLYEQNARSPFVDTGANPGVSYDYRIRAVNEGGSLDSNIVTLSCGSADEPWVDILCNGANSCTIPSGGSATISWLSGNVTSCSISPGGWTGTSGSRSTGSLTSRTTYTATCTGSAGSASDSVTVYMEGTQPGQISVNLTANPSSGAPPLSVDLLATTDAAPADQVKYWFDCTNDGTWDFITGYISSQSYTYSCSYNALPQTAKVKAKAKFPNDSFSDPDTDTVTISLAGGSLQCSDGLDNDDDGLIDYPADPGCSSPNDDDEYNVPPPEGGISCSFSGNPKKLVIPPPKSSLLTWLCNNADACSISQGIGSVDPQSGTVSVSPTSTTRYVLSCSNEDGTSNFEETIRVFSLDNLKEILPIGN